VCEKELFGTNRYAIASGYLIHYVEVGEGHPLVLIPPSFGTWRNWQRVAPGLARHFQVLAVDYVGIGESEKPARGFRYTPQEQSDVFAGLLDALNIERAHLMGVSYGGTIALNFAGRYPERTGRVVAIEGFVSVEKGLPGWSRLQSWLVGAPLIGDVFFAVVRLGLLNRSFARSIAGPWWEEMTEVERREWLAYVASEVRYANRPGWGGIKRSLFSTKDVDLRPEARRIRAPVLLLVGGRSAYREHIQPTLDFLRAEVPSVRIVEIPDGIHDLEWQKSQEVLRLALEHLGGLRK
jgi:pimeloyl-ACP methyl ester carboxylesterase